MSARRTSAILTVIAMVAAVLGLSATSQASGATPKAAPATISPTLARAAATVGQPSTNYVPPPTSFFSYPNRGRAGQQAIRIRVLKTIRSVWGGPKTPRGMTYEGNGTIRIATWTLADWEVARALVAAQRRGVSVQIVAARSANKDHQQWKWLKRKLGQRTYIPGKSGSRDKVSFARECRGACRGPGGTAHAKYFMFDNVGSGHVHNVVVQSSMNLTVTGYKGQWNQAFVNRSAAIYDQFLSVFRETRIGRATSPSFRSFNAGTTVSLFFPLRGGNKGNDPVMKMLNRTSCTGHTKIRIIQYAIYGSRGTYLAKKLRSMWSRGCDVRIIYSVSSRPVISILRNGSGRGRIPMKQSVTTNRQREIVKYNHSKWMSIMGPQGSYVMTGSSNWSAFAFAGDEQIQEIKSRFQAGRHNSTFNTTWRQKTSHPPMYGKKGSEGRIMWDIPPQPTFGKGIYKNLSANGD
jgi:phosphatidylserine/phosphatidylglycerophosphate/cardiolipin synthase-like enzyme